MYIRLHPMTGAAMRFPWMRSKGFPIEPEIRHDKGESMSSQVLTPNTESAMLARILQADEQELTLDAARYWLSVKLPASDQDRVDELSAKARAGSLTEAETQELDNYLHIGFLLGTMQAKARRLLPTESTLTPQ
jgi:hypothetical protein